MNRNLSTIFFSWVSSHLVCKNIQLIQLWGVGNVGSHLAERSRVWSQPPLVYLPVQDNYRLNELKCSYRCTSVLSYNIQHVKKSSVCVCMHQCVCVCVWLKDESAACYHCFEKCQTASSSTESPTLPDIWRRGRERVKETGRQGGVREDEGVNWWKAYCVTCLWKNERDCTIHHD